MVTHLLHCCSSLRPLGSKMTRLPVRCWLFCLLPAALAASQSDLLSNCSDQILGSEPVCCCGHLGKKWIKQKNKVISKTNFFPVISILTLISSDQSHGINVNRSGYFKDDQTIAELVFADLRVWNQRMQLKNNMMRCWRYTQTELTYLVAGVLVEDDTACLPVPLGSTWVSNVRPVSPGSAERANKQPEWVLRREREAFRFPA